MTLCSHVLGPLGKFTHTEPLFWGGCSFWVGGEKQEKRDADFPPQGRCINWTLLYCNCPCACPHVRCICPRIHLGKERKNKDRLVEVDLCSCPCTSRRMLPRMHSCQDQPVVWFLASYKYPAGPPRRYDRKPLESPGPTQVSEPCFARG